MVWIASVPCVELQCPLPRGVNGLYSSFRFIISYLSRLTNQKPPMAQGQIRPWVATGSNPPQRAAMNIYIPWFLPISSHFCTWLDTRMRAWALRQTT